MKGGVEVCKCSVRSCQVFTFIFCHLADAFIQSDLQVSKDSQALEDSDSERAVVQTLK